MSQSANQLLLISRPKDHVSRSNFRITAKTLPELQAGQVLVKVIYLSIDPAIRMYISDRKTYWKQVGLNEPVPTLGIGTVVLSSSKRFKPGELVRGMMACADFDVVDEKELFPIPPMVKHLPMLMGPLGHHGLTAFVGLVEVGQVKRGETVLVSAAAGATGSSVVQIAKLLGCKVIGIVGSESKRQWVTRALPCDGCLNYKESDSLTLGLQSLCPQGVDIYWDNVGGSTLDAAISHMNPGGRAILCGAISGYDQSHEDPCFNHPLLIERNISLRGFVVRNYEKHYRKAIGAIMNWAKEGKLVSKETVLKGLERVPEGLRMVFSGENIGKTIVQVGEDPTKKARL